MVAAMSIVDTISRFMGGTATEEAREVRLARDALREAITSRNAARAAADKARADVERVQAAGENAAGQIEGALAAARAARTARQDARAQSLASGGALESDSELATRERDQLATLSDARIEKKAAEQALPGLIEAAAAAARELRNAQERAEFAVNAVVRAQAAWLARDLERLVGELSERYRTLAAAAELVGGIGAPPLPQLQFHKQFLGEPFAAFKKFRERLRDDSEVEF
jgi:hypothetical protein